MDEAGESASNFGDTLANVGKITAASFAAVTSTVSAASAIFVKTTGDVAAYGDNIDKMSQKMGMSAQAYQEWDAVMQHSGTSMETLKASMKTLANAAQTGSDAFKQLGISQEEISKLSQEQLFSRTITALQNVTDETQRTYLAGKTLGRGATELGALLNTSAEDTQKMKDRVHELGGVMTDEAVKAAAAYQDSLQDMSTAFDSLKRNMISEFLPAITSTMDGLTELFAGNAENGLPLITEGINSFTENVSKALPGILDTGTKIVISLADAVTQNLPSLIEAGTSAIISFADGIIKQLPMIADAGLRSIIAFADSITDSLPELIPAAVSAAHELAVTLTDPDTLHEILDAGFDLVVALVQGISNSLPELVDTAVDLVINFAEYLTDARNIEMIVTAGIKIVVALAEGLIKAAPKLLEGATKLTLELTGFISGQNWDEIGSSINDELARGLTTTSQTVIDAFSDTLDIVDGVFRTHLQDWYDETTKFWQGFGGYLYETLNADTIADTNEKNSRETRATALRQDIQNRAKELIELGEESKSAFSQAISEYTSSADDKSIFDEYGLAEYFNNEKIKEAAATFQSEAKEAKGAIDYYTEHYKQKDLAGSAVAALPLDFERTREEIQKTAEEIAEETKAIYDAGAAEIERATVLNGLSIENQAALWRQLQAQIDESSEYYVKIQKNINTLDEKSASERQKAIDDAQKVNEKAAADAKKAEENAAKEAAAAVRDLYNEGAESIRLQAKLEGLSIDEQLKLWDDLLQKFDENSDYYNKIIEKEFDLREKQRQDSEKAEQQALKDAQAEVEQQYKDGVSNIEYLVKMNDLSLSEQIEQWEAMLGTFGKNSEQYKQIQLQIKSLQDKVREEDIKALEEYKKKVEDINKQIDDIRQDYANKLENRTKDIMNSFGLFAEVPERILYSGKDLTKNLEDQVLAIQKFYSDIDKLAQRGVSKELVSVIQSMGVGAMDQLDALLDLSDDELMKYSSLYDEKVQLSAELAEKQLAEEKAEIDRKIEELTAGFDDIVKENGESLGFGFAESFAKGIIDGTTTIEKAMEELFSDSDYSMAVGKPSSDYLATAEASSYAPSGLSNLAKKAGQTAEESIASIIVNVNGIQYQDITELAAAVGQEIQFLLNRRNAGYAGA